MKKSKPARIIDAMIARDQFSRWLGVERLEEREGYCKLRMTIRPEMCNGFDIAHGGITYSFADSALAFASNSSGKHAISIETSISHIKALKAGEIIMATAFEKRLGKQIANYEVKVERENGELVAWFKGTVFRKDQEWELE